MTIVGKFIFAGMFVGALATASFAQVRTFGPAAPFLVTGRSVSVPAYHQQDQQPLVDPGHSGLRQSDDAAPADPGAVQAGPR